MARNRLHIHIPSTGRVGNASLPSTIDFQIDTLFAGIFHAPMHGDDLPHRKVRGVFHCPPDWVPTSATFFLTLNCQQRGVNQLANPSCAAGIVEALDFYHRERRWQVELAMIMPDHLHMLMSFQWDPGNGMMAMIRNWKRYTANHLGIVWQRDYFDHRIRTENDHQTTWFYIRENPVRAGLVESFEKWPYVWRPEHGMGWRDDGRDLFPKGP